MTGSARSERNAATRERIRAAAERLFAEHGVATVSNRTIAEAAGQGNTAVVGYHFGTKVDLVRAIVRHHAGPIETRREHLLARVDGSAQARDWVDALVRPTAEHLASLGAPTWYARFAAQVMTDPALREIVIDDALGSPSVVRLVDGLGACLPALPPEVRRERGDITRLLVVTHFAERERALADGTPTVRATWGDAATGLVDALVGVWTAPVSGAHAHGAAKGTVD